MSCRDKMEVVRLTGPMRNRIPIGHRNGTGTTQSWILLDAHRRCTPLGWLLIVVFLCLIRSVGVGLSQGPRWLVDRCKNREGQHTPVPQGFHEGSHGARVRPTATSGIPLTGLQQEQVWNQPPYGQQTLSDGNYVYGWYKEMRPILLFQNL